MKMCLMKKWILGSVLIASSATFAGPMVGGGPNVNTSTEIVREFLRQDGSVVSMCLIDTNPDQVYVHNSDGTTISLKSPINKQQIDNKIYLASQEPQQSLTSAPKGIYMVVYARNLYTQVMLYDSRAQASSVRRGPASHFLLQATEKLCSRMY